MYEFLHARCLSAWAGYISSLSSFSCLTARETRNAIRCRRCCAYLRHKILAAAWNSDSCRLAVATEGGGVRIYELLPTPANGRPNDHLPGGKRCSPPATLVLRHNISARRVLRDVQAVHTRGCAQVVQAVKRSKSKPPKVTILASSSAQNGLGAGAETLVGIVDGQHLCVWHLLAGSSLLAANNVARHGCKVERVSWYGPMALAAVTYEMADVSREAGVFQLDITRKKVAKASDRVRGEMTQSTARRLVHTPTRL